MPDAPLFGVAADLGATHARFALARRSADGKIALLQPRTLYTADFAGLEAAYETYVAGLDTRPRHAALAVAGPVTGDDVKLTNSAWSFNRPLLRATLGLDVLHIVNDFAAIAHALPQIGADGFRSLNSETFVLPPLGAISVVGPGSGLGVAMLLREQGRDVVVPSEGGHISYAPTDAVEQRILALLASRYPHVSVERLVCGEGLVRIYEALAAFEGETVQQTTPVQLWDAALSGEDALAVRARERWLMMLGAFAGDIALVHGARAVVFAGGILPRFGDQFDASGLMAHLRAKGRFEAILRDLPVALLKCPEPGLLGAAALLR